MGHIFVIDDTGSPGNPSQSIMLKSDRKTYVAVFIKENYREKIKQDIARLLVKVNNNGVRMAEFHFTDLVNRRKEYKGLDQNQVLNIIKQFAAILYEYSLPFLNQTITPRTLEENGMKDYMPSSTLDEIALHFLYLRIKIFIQTNRISGDIDFVIDEGLKKDGEKMKIDELSTVTKNNYIFFESSTKNILLQVADFFAFALNRHQIIAIKGQRTNWDTELFKIIDPVLASNGVSGSYAAYVRNDDYGKEYYDITQIEYWKKMGVFQYWEKLNRTDVDD